MEKDAFSEFVESIAYHFGQDKFVQPGQATQKRLASWYNQVKQIPSETLSWMSQQIKDNFEYFPRNLSKSMLALWGQWQRDHPEKIIKPQEQTSCPDCIRGWIFAWKQKKNGGWLNAVWKCQCNCSSEQGEVTSRQDLENQGWWVEPRTYESGERHIINQHKPPAQNNQLSTILGNENQKG